MLECDQVYGLRLRRPNKENQQVGQLQLCASLVRKIDEQQIILNVDISWWAGQFIFPGGRIRLVARCCEGRSSFVVPAGWWAHCHFYRCRCKHRGHFSRKYSSRLCFFLIISVFSENILLISLNCFAISFPWFDLLAVNLLLKFIRFTGCLNYA